MRIITISGLDGSGKSTQIEKLKKYLEKQGRKVFYFHSVRFGIAGKINALKNKYCLFCRLTSKCSSEKEKSVTQSGAIGLFLRKIFLQIDCWRFEKLLEKLKKENFDFLLSDRYFYDVAVNIEYLAKNQLSKKNAKKYAKIRKPDQTFYLRANPENIMRRKRKPEQGFEYLKEKQNFYEFFAAHWQMKILDGNQTTEEIFFRLRELIQE